MMQVDKQARYAVAPGHRLQYEEAQQAWVVLYPEGMVKLNESAAEILKQCDGERSLQTIVETLERDFGESDLEADVLALVASALEQGWLRRL